MEQRSRNRSTGAGQRGGTAQQARHVDVLDLHRQHIHAGGKVPATSVYRHVSIAAARSVRRRGWAVPGGLGGFEPPSKGYRGQR